MTSDQSVNIALAPVDDPADVLERYCGTPIAALLAAQNLGRSISVPPQPPLVIVTCMDHRIVLEAPRGFAFQVRTAGAAVRPVVSNIAFALAATGIETIALIGHTDCAMTRAADPHLHQAFMDRMVDREQWSKRDARAQYDHLLDHFAIDDPMIATWVQAGWLGEWFPHCLIAPLLYDVADNRLSQLAEAP